MQIENILDLPYAALYEATYDGSESDILAALRGMVDVCPEVLTWLAEQVGVPESAIATALSLVSDTVTLEFDVATDADSAEQLLDDAALFGTLDDVVADLCDADPRAGKIICEHYGLRGGERTLVDIAAELSLSRETVRKHGKRGREAIKKRMEARGVTPS